MNNLDEMTKGEVKKMVNDILELPEEKQIKVLAHLFSQYYHMIGDMPDNITEPLEETSDEHNFTYLMFHNRKFSKLVYSHIDEIGKMI